MGEIRRGLLEILEELHPDEDFEGLKGLVTDKVLDSFDIITLISEINDTFDVVISVDKIVPDYFDSLDALCRLIKSLLDED